LIAVRGPYSERKVNSVNQIVRLVKERDLTSKRDEYGNALSLLREWINAFTIEDYEDIPWNRGVDSYLDRYGYNDVEAATIDCNDEYAESRVSLEAIKLLQDGWIVSEGRMRDSGEGGNVYTSYIRDHKDDFEIVTPDFIVTFGGKKK
jgi:hypothetical protein